MAVDPSWALPLAEKLYEHRDKVDGVWRKIVDTLLGKKYTIAFTGLAGAGKTVLFDQLSHTANARSYSAPKMASMTAERGRVAETAGKRVAIVVVPGQESPARFEALDEVLRRDNRVDGVVHVVTNGFVEIRDASAKRGLIEKGVDLARFREIQRQEELKDLENVCGEIRRAHQRAHSDMQPLRPRWLLVAAAKVDLYYDEIAVAERYYSPGGDSEFTRTIRAMSDQVGTDNFRWDCAPVCAWLQEYTWGAEVRPCLLGDAARWHYLARFANTLESLCV